MLSPSAQGANGAPGLPRAADGETYIRALVTADTWGVRNVKVSKSSSVYIGPNTRRLVPVPKPL